jgi:serine/threonine-protein kinase
VHRDVKPSNLFLVREPSGEVRVRVTDFGLAKVHDEVESLTTSGKFMGSPHYVSPEQAVNAKAADERSDVWGLAMSLYHALAGAPAFAYVRSFMGLVLELTARDAPHLQDAAPWVEAPIARVVHAALIRDRAARCPSARELSLALEGAIGIDACRAAIDPRAVRAASAAERGRVAARAELPQSWDEVLRT